MPPLSLMVFMATWEPWSMAWPRLARLPEKHERTPIVTGPVGRWEAPALLLLPQAASTNAATVELARRRQAPGCRLVPFCLGCIRGPQRAAKPPRRFRARVVEPRQLVNGWTTQPAA